MWLAGWTVRALLLITAPIYYLSRFISRGMSRLDAWSFAAIHAHEPKKPPQADKTLSEKWKVRSGN